MRAHKVYFGWGLYDVEVFASRKFRNVAIHAIQISTILSDWEHREGDFDIEAKAAEWVDLLKKMDIDKE